MKPTKPPVSASAVKIEGDGFKTSGGKKAYKVPSPMTADEIRATVANYRLAVPPAGMETFLPGFLQDFN